MPGGSESVGPGQALREHGLRPRKSLGQNFLRDRTFLQKIVEAADLGDEDEVLEVGPGTGVLTQALADRTARVVAVELDGALVQLLANNFPGIANVEVIHDNALNLDPCSLFDRHYKLVANIPYYITGPILRHYLEARCAPRLLILMLQKEVAQRLTAAPPSMSLLGLSAQFYADVDVVARVPRGAFLPPPKVDSAIVRLRPHPASDPEVRDAVFKLAHAGFAERRKQIANSMSSKLGWPRDQIDRLLAAGGIAASRRAETLTVPEWRRLAEELLSLQEGA